ncbi:hypothetical protein [Kosmotoga pacifica]|uniref:Uncharacterized protein n=1 Tax=Kosmotoga pacifica TaxID=1330330 RepID=A0A0G2ZD56_9BACT|nr:hypothetical protein [Kosmotoga pacifica]AKI97484.1 hypothetical protein IX53_06245 [Kosmotoga pacifica]
MNREEVMKILRLIYEKKVTPEDGYNLIKELVEEAEPEYRIKGKKLSILVIDKRTGEKKANIVIPANLASFAAKFVKGKHIYTNGMPLDVELEELIREVIKTTEPIEIDTEDVKVIIRMVN